MARIRRVDDQREMEKVIDDFVTQGYRIKEQGENSTMMKEKDWGSGGMHLIVLVFWVGGPLVSQTLSMQLISTLLVPK